MKTRREARASIHRKVKKGRDGKPYVSWAVSLGQRPLSKERVRIERTDRRDLENAIDEFYRTNQAGGLVYASLTASEAADARAALDFLAASGMPNATLFDAARALVDGPMETRETAPMATGDALAAYLAENGPRWSAVQRKTVGYRVGRFVASVGSSTQVADVTREEVASWLRRFQSPTSRNNALKYLSAFFRWCSDPARRWCGIPPTDGEKPSPIAYSEPQFVRAEKVESLFREAERREDRRLLAYLALGFLMGIRTEEIVRLCHGDGKVDVEDGSVRISMPKGWTRGRVPRIVPMEGNTREWFRVWNLVEALHGMDARRARKRAEDAARAVGFTLPHNAARHTFITMYIALTNDAAKAMTVAGTGRQHVARSYMGLAKRKEAEAFFDMMPTRR